MPTAAEAWPEIPLMLGADAAPPSQLVRRADQHGRGGGLILAFRTGFRPRFMVGVFAAEGECSNHVKAPNSSRASSGRQPRRFPTGEQTDQPEQVGRAHLYRGSAVSAGETSLDFVPIGTTPVLAAASVGK